MKEEKTDLSERVEQLEKSNQEIPGITMKLLWEAWDSGWLTQEDLSSIAYYHQGTYLNEELMGENFEPKPLKPLSVGEEDVLKVFLWLYNGGLRSNRTPADCIIKEYYGVYNGCVVLIYGGLSDGGGDASFMVPIGGVNFQYNDDMIIVVQFK